jgi:hypothetical protein
MRLFSATLALKPVVTEAGEKDVSGAVDTALADPTIDADVTSEAAVEAVRTTFGASTGLKVFVDDSASPTRAQVIAALEGVIAQIKTSNVYSGA